MNETWRAYFAAAVVAITLLVDIVFFPGVRPVWLWTYTIGLLTGLAIVSINIRIRRK